MCLGPFDQRCIGPVRGHQMHPRVQHWPQRVQQPWRTFFFYDQCLKAGSLGTVGLYKVIYFGLDGAQGGKGWEHIVLSKMPVDNFISDQIRSDGFWTLFPTFFPRTFWHLFAPFWWLFGNQKIYNPNLTTHLSKPALHTQNPSPRIYLIKT